MKFLRFSRITTILLSGVIFLSFSVAAGNIAPDMPFQVGDTIESLSAGEVFDAISEAHNAEMVSGKIKISLPSGPAHPSGLTSEQTEGNEALAMVREADNSAERSKVSISIPIPPEFTSGAQIDDFLADKTFISSLAASRVAESIEKVEASHTNDGEYACNWGTGTYPFVTENTITSCSHQGSTSFTVVCTVGHGWVVTEINYDQQQKCDSELDRLFHNGEKLLQ